MSLNFVPEPETSREAAARDVFTAQGGLRGHKSNLFLLAAKASLTTQRDSPRCRLSPALLLAACPPLCLLVMKLLPIFHTLLPVGFSPFIDIEQQLWLEVVVLSNL